MPCQYRNILIGLTILLCAQRALRAEDSQLSADELLQLDRSDFAAPIQIQDTTPIHGAKASSGAADSCSNVTNSDYNPHSPPTTGGRSWFEGWYVRVSDDDGVSSLAVGIGHFPDQDLPDPSAACFILASASGEPPRLYTRNFDSLRVETPAPAAESADSAEAPLSCDRHSGLKHDDVPAAAAGTTSGDGCGSGSYGRRRRRRTGDGGGEHAADSGAVSFQLEAGGEGVGDFCFWTVTQGSFRINARLGGAGLRLRSAAGICTAAKPWGGPAAPTPEGWLARLGFLLRLRYDVLSLSTAVQYEFRENRGSEDADADDVDRRGNAGGAASGGGAVSGPLSESEAGLEPRRQQLPLPLPPPRPPRPAVVWRAGQVHLEKNWGESFPDEWIWIQGHRNDAAGQASVVLAGGLLPHILEPLIPATRQFALSYHPPPPAAPFTLDPREPPLFNSLTVHGCEGLIYLELYSIMHVVQVVAAADPATFQALPCPTATGFRNYSVESFSARVQLRVLRRPYPLAPAATASLLFEDIFVAAAMEFGGGYVCSEGLPQLREVVGEAGMDAWARGGSSAAAGTRRNEEADGEAVAAAAPHVDDPRDGADTGHKDLR